MLLYKNLTWDFSQFVSLSKYSKCVDVIPASPVGRLIQPSPKLFYLLDFLPTIYLSLPDQHSLVIFPLMIPQHYWVLHPRTSIVSQGGYTSPPFPPPIIPSLFSSSTHFSCYLGWWFFLMFLYCSRGSYLWRGAVGKMIISDFSGLSSWTRELILDGHVVRWSSV